MNDRLIGEIVGAKRATMQQVERRQLRGGTIARLAGPEQLQQELVTPFDSASACSARSRSRAARRPWLTATLNPATSAATTTPLRRLRHDDAAGISQPDTGGRPDARAPAARPETAQCPGAACPRRRSGAQAPSASPSGRCRRGRPRGGAPDGRPMCRASGPLLGGRLLLLAFACRRARWGVRDPARRRRVATSSGDRVVKLIRSAAAQQLVEQHAERIDVARGDERFAADLLGTRVLRRHHPRLDAASAAAARRSGIDQLRDAEIEQMHARHRRRPGCCSA